MNLRDLAYIDAVARHLHFGRAAEDVSVSQPTLSGQVKKLEARLGVALFERSSRGVKLTPFGAKAAEQARVALNAAREIERLAAAERNPLAGPLRLGAIPTIGPYLLPTLLPAISAALPRLQVVVSEETTDALLERLRSGEVDVALLATDASDNELEQLPLYIEPFWVAYPTAHRLSQIPEVDSDDLRGDELLLLRDGHCLRDQALAACAMTDAPEETDLRAASLETLVGMVAAGLGITLLPATALRPAWLADTGISVSPLRARQAERQVSLTLRRDYPRRPLIDRLADIVREKLPDTVTALEAPA